MSLGNKVRKSKQIQSLLKYSFRFSILVPFPLFVGGMICFLVSNLVDKSFQKAMSEISGIAISLALLSFLITNLSTSGMVVDEILKIYFEEEKNK